MAWKQQIAREKKRRIQTIFIALACITAYLVQPEAWATRTLKRATDPLLIQTLHPVDTQSTAPGTLFEGVLAEEHQFQGRLLPQGTLFKGFIQQAQPSRRFARPGYAVINLQEMLLPNGERHQLNLIHGMGVRSQKLNRSGAKSIGDFTKKALPMSAASLGTSIPLGVASGLHGGIIYAITTGARMAMGAASFPFINEPPGSAPLRQSAYGAWYGTAVPGTLDFLGRDKNMFFNTGEVLPIRLPEETVSGLFSLQTLVQTPSPTPLDLQVQPAAEGPSP